MSANSRALSGEKDEILALHDEAREDIISSTRAAYESFLNSSGPFKAFSTMNATEYMRDAVGQSRK